MNYFILLIFILISPYIFAQNTLSELEQPFTYLDIEGTLIEIDNPKVVFTAILEALTQAEYQDSQIISPLKVTLEDGRIIEIKDTRAAIHQLWQSIIASRDPNQPAHIVIKGADGEEWILEDAGANFETFWKSLTTGGGDPSEYIKNIPGFPLSSQKAEATAKDTESIAEKALQEVESLLQLLDQLQD